MKFIELKSLFDKGELAKSDYIHKSFDVHRHLFEYVEVIKNTDINEIRVLCDGVAFSIGEESIWLYAPADEARVAPLEVMNFGSYEPQETELMDLLSRECKCILDIGANIGWYSSRFAKVNSSAHVYAFEPLPQSYQYLQKNIALNQLGARVSCYSFGLSDVAGAIDFYITPTNGTNASLKNVADDDRARLVKGLVMTLDDWVKNIQVVPDFIKCDVEGAELLVFKGGYNTLVRDKPIVFTELLRKWSKPFGYHPSDLIQFFNELGYDCFAVGVNGVRDIAVVDESTLETNYVFLHRDKHQSELAMVKKLV